MDKFSDSKIKTDAELKRIFSNSDNIKQPFSAITRFESGEDLDIIIKESFDLLMLLILKKNKLDCTRILLGLFFSFTMLFVIFLENIYAIGLFFIISIGIALLFTQTQKQIFPIQIKIRAYEGVLLELHKVKILREHNGRAGT
jgi:hypothetical protein